MTDSYDNNVQWRIGREFSYSEIPNNCTGQDLDGLKAKIESEDSDGK